MIYVIGGGGFVGSAYVRLFVRLGLPHRVITRANWKEFRGTRCDVIINANGNSKKFLAEKNPLGDFDLSVRSVAESLDAFSCSTYVMLSSGDVYPDQSRPSSTCEDQQIDPAKISRYGQHKLVAEQLLRGDGRHWLIMRMGGFVGAGLKKNAIFDMLTNTPVWLSPDSELQFISTDHAAEIVWTLVEQDICGETINLGGTGLVQLVEIHRDIGSHSPFKPDAPTIRYELDLTKLKRLYHGTLPQSSDEVHRFVCKWKAGALAV